MSKKKILTHRCLVLLLVTVVFSGCAASIPQERILAGIKSSDALPAIVDVRTGGEFAGGHLPGAVNISVLTLPFNMDRVPVADRDKVVVVYCAHGPRAGLAGFFLRLAGFTNVYHLQGDFVGWHKGGYPIVVNDGESDASVP